MQNSSNSEESPSLTPINLHILHSLWLPDVEILDLKAFETHSVLSKLEGMLIVFIFDLTTTHHHIHINFRSYCEVVTTVA